MKIIVISGKDAVAEKINQSNNFLKHDISYYKDIDELNETKLHRTNIILIDIFGISKQQINKLLSFRQINSNMRVVCFSNPESKSLLNNGMGKAIDHFEENYDIETFLEQSNNTWLKY